MKKNILLLLMFLQTIHLFAQNITILPSGITPAQGGGIDRMTSVNRTATAFQNAQNAGKLVFDIDKGHLYLWDGTSWSQLLDTKLDAISTVGRVATDAKNGDRFGNSVSIKGDWAAVGALAVDSQEGEVYIFKRGLDGWEQVKRLRQDISTANSTISVGAKFGASVDLDLITVGSTQYPVVIAGAPEQGTGGRAFVFRYTDTDPSSAIVLDWVLEQTLSHISPLVDDDFGNAVSISQGRLAVGAPYDDVLNNSGTSITDAGSVTTFTFTNTAASGTAPTGTWARDVITTGQPTLRDASINVDNWFGFSVAIDGNNLAVGVPLENTNDYGKVMLYNNGPSWTLIKTFDQTNLAATTENGVNIGWSVALSGLNLLIGVPNDDVSGTVDAGTAHLVHNNTGSWTNISSTTITKIYNPFFNSPDSENSKFGHSVSINGNYMMIGAPFFKNGSVSNVGYVVALPYNSTYFTGGDYNFVNTSPFSPQIKIQNPYSTSGVEFGRAVGISSEGNFIIGAPLNSPSWTGQIHLGNVISY